MPPSVASPCGRGVEGGHSPLGSSVRSVKNCDVLKKRPTTSLETPKTEVYISSDDDSAYSSNKGRSKESVLRRIQFYFRRASSDSSSRSIMFSCKFSSAKVLVLIILSLQNSLYTLVRRYSLGVRKEKYSKYEVLLVGEFIKLVFSAWMINRGLIAASDATSSATSPPSQLNKHENSIFGRLSYLCKTSSKMVGLALIYGAMNILSLIALRNIGAGLFTIFAQTKILTTAVFSTILLRRKYSWTKWRALAGLSLGVLVFSEPNWREAATSGANFLGLVAVTAEVTLSGFASIYFEKVIKTDPLQLSIWERNFQLALGSIPVYIFFLVTSGDPFLQGWSPLAGLVAILGAAGGLLVALSIKYGDAILKTLATTAAIVLSSVLDWAFLGGMLTPVSIISCGQVVVAICNYTFDATPVDPSSLLSPIGKDSERPHRSDKDDDDESKGDEEVALLRQSQTSTR